MEEIKQEKGLPYHNLYFVADSSTDVSVHGIEEVYGAVSLSGYENKSFYKYNVYEAGALDQIENDDADINDLISQAQSKAAAIREALSGVAAEISPKEFNAISKMIIKENEQNKLASLSPDEQYVVSKFNSFQEEYGFTSPYEKQVLMSLKREILSGGDTSLDNLEFKNPTIHERCDHSFLTLAVDLAEQLQVDISEGKHIKQERSFKM